MKTVVKMTMAAFGSGGIFGNTALVIFVKDHYVVISEGAVMGFLTGQEAAALGLHFFIPKDGTSNDSAHPEDKTPLNPKTSPA